MTPSAAVTAGASNQQQEIESHKMHPRSQSLPAEVADLVAAWSCTSPKRGVKRDGEATTNWYDQATYERPNQTSRGVKDLLVGGTFVIRNGDLDTNAFPGQPVRRSGAAATRGDVDEH